jgi:hypothetical protein
VTPALVRILRRVAVEMRWNLLVHPDSSTAAGRSAGATIADARRLPVAAEAGVGAERVAAGEGWPS